MINQGMILGRSNFAYRVKDTNTFVSYGLKDLYETTAIHVDVNLVENDVLDVKPLKRGGLILRMLNSSSKMAHISVGQR